MSRHPLAAVAVVVAILPACTKKSNPASHPGGSTGETGTPSGDDSAVGDTGMSVLGDCTTLGLPERDFVDAEDDASLFATAADFTVPVEDVDGNRSDWNLRDHWTGCDSYLIIPDNPAQASGYTLWSRDVDTLFERLPKNTQLLFVSEHASTSGIEASIEDMRSRVNDVLAAMSSGDAAWWRNRVHFVTAYGRGLDGWVGANMKSPNWGVAIDRFQRIRYIGSFADPSRYNSETGWFDPNLSMAANEPIFYNYEAETQAELDADGATVETLFDHQIISDSEHAGTMAYVDVALPDADTMATFDTMTFDLTLGCVGDGEYGDCPAWDYIASLYLCDQDDPTSCTTEIGRWITTYHRHGRWVHDASALLPLLKEGGTRRFAFYTQQEYETSLYIRLSKQGKETRPTDIEHLWTGGAFDASYNDNHSPITVTIPEDAAKVELATVLSGHGQVGDAVCAEFCETDHVFTVNGHDNTIKLDNAGTLEGCMDMVDQGVIPNQYGTWWYGRSGWCPGWQVPVQVTDITDQVNKGGENTISYAAYYNGGTFDISGAKIELQSWLVIEK